MLDKEHRLAFGRLGSALNETKKQKEGNLSAKKEPEKNSGTELSVLYLPEIISENITLLSTLSSKVDAAQNAAKEAEAEAEYAAGRKSGIGHHTNAIEALQDSAVASARSQKEIVNAQRVSFDFQQRLAEISKLLFNLGVTNIAMNRTVCRELELKLSGASKEKLNDLAKQELMNVISQLKAQEDMMVKQEKQMQLIKEHTLNLAGIRTDMTSFESSINAVEKITSEQNHRIVQNTNTLATHKEILREQQEKDEEFARMFAEQDLEDARQDEKISENAQALADHEEILKEQQEKDEEFTRMFVEQDLEDARQDKQISENADKIYKAEENIEKNRVDIQKNLDKINYLIAEVTALKNAETEAEKKIAQAKIIAFISGGIGIVSLVLSALIAFGVI